MKGWQLSDIERLQSRGIKVEGINPSPKMLQKTVKLPKKEPVGLSHIKEVLWLLKIDFETEYRFHEARKFRFDVCIKDKLVAIEYEGLHSAKSGHTTIDGFNSNIEKYNLATVNGWRLLRYTANNYMNFYNDLKILMEL